jgi:hypothetical protein
MLFIQKLFIELISIKIVAFLMPKTGPIEWDIMDIKFLDIQPISPDIKCSNIKETHLIPIGMKFIQFIHFILVIVNGEVHKSSSL